MRDALRSVLSCIIQALLNLSKIDGGLAAFTQGQGAPLPPPCDSAAHCCLCRLFLRAHHPQPAGERSRSARVCVASSSLPLSNTPFPPPPNTQTLHEHDPSTFAKMFSRPLAEHVRDNAPQEDSGGPKQPQVDVKFLLGGEEGEHGGGGRH